MTCIDIQNLKNELNLQEILADNLYRELYEIRERSINGKVSKKDEYRTLEISELLRIKTKWVNEARKELAVYYRPAVA